ncbi:CPBP family intramembrane glutamic endopeptidase [Lactobacillus kullabergensis]|uniref:CAAX prenyl protease 2/Lysostaphin resistance protein A-like domain-containing protein n=1 Tax=Lactobacillus kullabergensis TaxID=1218493 RepID=A0ABN5LIE9_9LACO|nr:CPBP family intramembrane glutamic endopeptidase [Lactobacillus kullabergensis]AWM75980.1 hypothetical protein DKL58_08320 [Lactobacillus kullabergensis]
MKCLNQNAETAGSLKTIRIFHLAQTVGQLGILVICFYFGLRNAKLFAPKECNAILSSFILVCFFILVCLQFSLLQTEAEKPNGLQLFNHYFETITICCTLPQCLALLTKLLNYYHLINGTFWMLLVTFYSFFMYIPMAKLALSRVNNNWGRILLFLFIVYSQIMWTARNIAVPLDSHYNKVLRQINNAGLSGIPILIIITVMIMSSWKIQRPHFTFSRNDSILFSTLITLLLVGRLLLLAIPQLVKGVNIAGTLNSYFNQINLGIIGRAVRVGIAEEWLCRFVVISLLAQIFYNNKYRIYLIVLFDGILFGLWHLLNLRSDFKNTLPVLKQVIEVTGWAFVVAAVYLYTHSLLLTMTYHSLYDLIVFLFYGSITKYGNTTKSVVQPTIVDWQGAFLWLAIYAVIALVIIWTKRRQKVIEQNLAQI